MDIFETRRRRLRELIDDLTQGNISVFGRRFGYSRAQLSQFISENYNDGRSIGERAARSLEEKIGLKFGWLDLPYDSPRSAYTSAAGLGSSPSSDLSQQSNPTWGRVKVKFVGYPVPKQEGLVELFPIPDDELGNEIEFAPASGEAYAIIVKGSGLRPRAKSGEYLVVDPTITPSPGDDVLVKLAHDGSELVLQLLYFKDDDVTLGNANESGPAATLAVKDIVYMHSIRAILSIPSELHRYR